MNDKKTDNQSLRQRLHRVIPGGAHTYSRGDDQFPQNAPSLLARGRGAWVWDTDGNKYLDYGMALRSVTLGYGDDRVNAAAIKELEKGVGLTRASMTELLAAERICDMVPSAEMVKFAKNGSNVTTAAVKIARAFTGRKYVCIPRQHPFFSFDDWFIGTTPLKRGVDMAQAAATLVFDYNDIASLQALFDRHGRDIAAVMLEPATHLTPCDQAGNPVTYDRPDDGGKPKAENSFLHQVRDLAHANGALLIFDEMITGFRWHTGGAQTYFDVMPDLSTFGKAMANGYALAAVTGRRECMEVGSIDKPGMERTFLLSSTHGGEMPALGAFLEASRICADEDVPGHLWAYGSKLKDGLNSLAKERGLAGIFEVEGPPVALNYVTRDPSGEPSAVMRTIFAQEMTLEAAAGALDVYARAVAGTPEDFLQGEAVKPVFRKIN